MLFLRNESRSQADIFSVPNISFVWTSLFQINRRKRLFLILNIVTVIKLTKTISNFQIIYTFGAEKISKVNVSSCKLRPWFTKGDAPPSKTCKFDLINVINGEAHSNVSGLSDPTLAECYKLILPTSKTTLNQPCGEQSSIKQTFQWVPEESTWASLIDLVWNTKKAKLPEFAKVCNRLPEFTGHENGELLVLTNFGLQNVHNIGEKPYR